MAEHAPQSRLAEHPGVRAFLEYPLLDAILSRRSRRFALGSEIPGGPTKYRSRHAPVPLDEVEEAFLITTGTGLTGMLLGDLPFLDDRGRDSCGNTLIHFRGLTYASPCGSHDTHLIYWNDEGTYLVKHEAAPITKVREYETPDDLEKVLANFRSSRVKLFDGRPRYPRDFPVMLPFNQWSSDIPGSTVMLPVIDTTFEYINVLLLMCGWPDGGFYFVDDLNGGRPCGNERWVKEGLLKEMLRTPISVLGNVNILEAGFVMQNISLTTQAMGLGGWVHASAAPLVLLGGTPMAKGLGFRFITPKRALSGPSCVGLDGLIEAYCPPYYPSMDAAVDAVVAAKFGKQGIYTEDSDQPLPLRSPNEFIAAVPKHDERVVQCVKDMCNYIYETFGRFPPTVDAVTTPGAWVQAHHLDTEFYDRFYQEGAYTETQARHMELWHGPEAQNWAERALAAVGSA